MKSTSNFKIKLFIILGICVISASLFAVTLAQTCSLPNVMQSGSCKPCPQGTKATEDVLKPGNYFCAVVLGQDVQNALTSTTSSSYKYLAPIGNDQYFNPGEIKDGRNIAFGKYLNWIIKTLIGLAAVAAVVMIVMGGIQYMTSELVNTKEQAKSMITNAVIGIIIALGAYTLLYTVNPQLLKTDVEIEEATLEIASEDIPQAAVNGYFNNGKYKAGSAWDQAVAGGSPLITNGACPNGNLNCVQYTTIVPGECTTVGQKNCTSIKGLDISILRSTQWGCKCALTVTGGTESWLHSSKTTHRPGSGTIDLRENAELNRYITNGETKFPADGRVYIRDGIRYFAERAGQTANTSGKHWHVYR